MLVRNPECRYLASSSKDGSLRIWDTVLGRCEKILTGHTQSVTCVKWGGDGLLYTSSQDRTVKVWRAKDVSCYQAAIFISFQCLLRTALANHCIALQNVFCCDLHPDTFFSRTGCSPIGCAKMSSQCCASGRTARETAAKTYSVLSQHNCFSLNITFKIKDFSIILNGENIFYMVYSNDG